MSRPLAVAIFDRREVDSSGDYVLLSVASDDGQENLHIDGEYAVYRRTDGPELEAIVRDLAANEPLAEMNSDYPQYRYCLYCEANNAPGPGQPETSDPPGVVHADGCNWRNAVEWVERHA